MNKSFGRIVVPIDGSDRSLTALPVGVEIAERVGIPITALMALQTSTDVAAAALVLDELVDRTTPDATVEAVVRRADLSGPAATIASEAARDGALICIASHGRRGVTEILLGSTTEGVLRISANPVLVVGPRLDPHRSVADGRVLACVDGSPFSESIVPAAISWATSLKQPICFVTVVDPDAASERDAEVAADELEHGVLDRLVDHVSSTSDVAVGSRVVRGHDVVRQLAALADELPASVLAVSTHGRTGRRRVTMGSVAMDIVRHVPCPVLVVRSRSLDS